MGDAIGVHLHQQFLKRRWESVAESVQSSRMRGHPNTSSPVATRVDLVPGTACCIRVCCKTLEETTEVLRFFRKACAPGIAELNGGWDRPSDQGARVE